MVTLVTFQWIIWNILQIVAEGFEPITDICQRNALTSAPWVALFKITKTKDVDCVVSVLNQQPNGLKFDSFPFLYLTAVYPVMNDIVNDPMYHIKLLSQQSSIQLARIYNQKCYRQRASKQPQPIQNEGEHFVKIYGLPTSPPFLPFLLHSIYPF